MRAALGAACGVLLAATAAAQRPTLGPAVRPFVVVDTSVVALTHVRVIDGTGAPPADDQTVVIENGAIATMGPTGDVAIPAGARIMDLGGQSVIPGLVMMHEHLFYPTGPGVYGNEYASFPRLYLAGGVTTMRTTGDVGGYGDLRTAAAIDSGREVGPWIDATGPYVQGPSPFAQMYALKDSADARRFVNFWADAGATSFKAYMNVTRAELAAAIDAAHKRGLKITGHLCSVTYREAADLGIDDLEHGFFVSTDFVPDKEPDVCPGQAQGMQALAQVDSSAPAFRSLVQDLVAHHVAVTSTLTVFETFTPGQPVPKGLDVLDPILKEQFMRNYERTQRNANSPYRHLFADDRAMELAFVHAGGLLLAGTDPTGGGGVIPGFADQRQVELLVGSGFTPLEAIKICTLNGATYLGRADRIGSIEVGKQADLVVIDGNPAENIDDIEKVTLVFKQGVGYDPRLLIDSVKGRVGLY
ncbi:MAG: amidohydrolase family protein [Gemmatimonadota bacterium]|nr:amidohydrolase family protein [Gemmatimonadota bacterium]MDE3127851.1 amidohydrolase family protein [Gemmatimonadota bacterium]MDE3173152.1 amidohydrolase family protein [Gemmatimonadota bacterium]MDE3215134.1 amidohydrolase family protein [Gemmatimonadota bacterium]